MICLYLLCLSISLFVVVVMAVSFLTTLLALDYFGRFSFCRGLSCGWFLDYWTPIRVIVEVNGFGVRPYRGQEGARLSFFFLKLEILFR